MISPIVIKEEPSVTQSEKSDTTGGAGELQQSLKKGPWSATEDTILMEYVRKHGERNWNAVQKNSGLQRCGKSCRLRWANHLRPNLKKGSFTAAEEGLILQLHAQLGNKWARMAALMPGRTDNEIKNYWNTRIKRRQRAGLPLYPPEIQRQVALMNQQQNALMFAPNSAVTKTLLSPISKMSTNAFHNAVAGGVNHLLRNFDQTQLLQWNQLPKFPLKMELPSIQLFPNMADDQKPPQLYNAFQTSQGINELFNDRLYTPYSDTPIGTNHAVKTLTNQDLSISLDTFPAHTTLTPSPAMAPDLYDLVPSIMTEDVITDEMQQIVSTLSTVHDWGFEADSWDNMPSIH